MADPYWRYPSSRRDERSPRAGFPAYRTSGSSILPPDTSYPRDARGGSSDYLQNNDFHSAAAYRGYRLDDVGLPGSRGTPPQLGMNGYQPAVRDPLIQGTDATEKLLAERAGLTQIADGPVAEEPKILSVDGLPTDCTRREVSHLFRQFIGFKDIKVIHKQPRRAGDRPHVFCFVEFKDGKCALTAMEALQGYKFDEKKEDSPTIQIQFAKFPLAPPTDDRQRFGGTF